MRLLFAASAILVPLLQSAEPLRSPPPYSCSRKAALRYQIVSSPARQELPHAVVRCLGSHAELPLRRRLGASPLHLFASTRIAAPAHAPSAGPPLVPRFSPLVPQEIATTPPSETAYRS